MYIIAIIAFVLGIVLFGIGMFLSYENEFKKILIILPPHTRDFSRE